MLATAGRSKKLPTRIERDPSTALPLASEEAAIRDLVLAYLALPYSLAEYGCGAKAHLIIERLATMDVPLWALSRGMVMERDMSPEALAEDDWHERPHALTVDNPLHRIGDLADPVLRELLDTAIPGVRLEGDELRTGPFVLHHEATVQFVKARSHIFPILLLWDAEQDRVVRRVVDPTIERDRFLTLDEVRNHVRAPESLIFEAPLLGHFWLSPGHLTDAQAREVARLVPEGPPIRDLPFDDHAELVRRLDGAEVGSIGDPATWSYANNWTGWHSERDALQLQEVGRGDALAPLTRDLIAARERHEPDLGTYRVPIDEHLRSIAAHRVVRRDARWAEEQLEPLADVAILMVYHGSLLAVAESVRSGRSLAEGLEDEALHEAARGLGSRLRRRIDRLAYASEDEHGRIDARALGPGFAEAAVETARQMNAAGMTVCVDRVGNLHGLLLDAGARDRLEAGGASIADLTRDALVYMSHLDTVEDGGRFDGRLGVAGGIEIAQLVTDLERYCDVRVRADGSPVVLMSTAYVGEEMRFTGEGVSMPGSAAVSGRASVEQVHRMESRTGLRFGDRLPTLLERLREAECAGEIRLHNRFAERAAEELLDACFEPTDFFTPHTYERHVEQGPQLSRAGVPAVVVDTIMGLRQEDLVLTGERCEAAALELVCRLRDLTDEERYQHTRISVGVVQPLGEAVCHRAPALALRLSLVGRKSHAGAMPTADRRDAGVAAGRVVRALDHWLGEHDPDCVPLVGDVSVDPSVNRNVVPDRARLTLALPEADRGPGGNRLVQILQGFVVGALTADVASGGEGIEIGGIERVSFVNTAKKVRVSLDLRDACADTLRRLRGELEDVLADVGAGYGVSFEASIEQQMAPQHLAETGQVLVLERTYGGGHNPEETELMEDLTSGTLLALAVAMDVLGRGSLDGCDLVAETTRRVPSSWREALAPFVSGLLPDTANTAAAVRERRARTG